MNGVGVSKDIDEALRFQLAAGQGHPQAEYRLGEIREKGWGAPNYGEAQRWYQLAADAGDPDAAQSLAQLYEEGYGQDPDLKRAVQRYRQASDQGLAEVQYRLAMMIEHGQEPPATMPRRQRYKASAEQGNAPARSSELYISGSEVPAAHQAGLPVAHACDKTELESGREAAR